MAWQLYISETADKQLSRLDKGIERKVRKYLEEACELADPTDRGHALTGPWAGFHRYRVGQIRIITRIEHQLVTVTVVTVGRRDSIY